MNKQEYNKLLAKRLRRYYNLPDDGPDWCVLESTKNATGRALIELNIRREQLTTSVCVAIKQELSYISSIVTHYLNNRN